MILIKEGQVYPVPPSLLSSPTCCRLILFYFSWYRACLCVRYLRFEVGEGEGEERGVGVVIWGPYLKRFSPALSSRWGCCMLIRCAGTHDPRRQQWQPNYNMILLPKIVAIQMDIIVILY